MPGISRRQFNASLLAAGGMAAGMNFFNPTAAAAADFKLRQFHNQPADSPLHKRLSKCGPRENGNCRPRRRPTFPDNDQLPGSHPAALKMLVDGELDFFTLSGGIIGTVVPSANVQGIPFAFHDEAQVIVPSTVTSALISPRRWPPREFTRCRAAALKMAFARSVARSVPFAPSTISTV